MQNTQQPSDNPTEPFEITLSLSQIDLAWAICAMEDYGASIGGSPGRRLEQIAFKWLLQTFRKHPLPPEMMETVIAQIREKVSNGEPVTRSHVALSGYFRRQLARTK